MVSKSNSTVLLRGETGCGKDVVARAINTEVKAGRGSVHGGAYLDIATQRCT